MRLTVTGLAFLMVTAGALGCNGDSVAAPPVASLRFVASPTSVTAGESFAASVELVDAGGDRVTSATGQVTLSISGGATLTGPLTIAASAGHADFAGLSLGHADQAAQLTATSNGLTVTSAPFAVAAAAPSQAQSSISAPPQSVVANTATSITFTFKDAFGNAVAAVPVAVSSNLPAVTFSPASGTTSAAGEFTTTFSAAATSTPTITATVDGVQLTFTPSIVVAADVCVPHPLTIGSTVTGALTNSGCIIDTRATAVYGFTLATAGGVSIVVNSSAFSTLFEVTAVPPTDNVRLAAEQYPASAEWLLPAGSYQARIGTLTGIGAYSFTTTPVPANAGCMRRFLVVGGTYTGQNLAADDCPYGDGTFYDEFLIFDSRPCSITLKTTAFNNYLEIDDPNADYQNIDFAGGLGINVDAHVVLASCRSSTGAISILANSYDPGQTGPYTLIVTIGSAAAHGAMRVESHTLAAPMTTANASPQTRMPQSRKRARN